MTATLLIISEDSKINAFMNACDVWEKGRVLGKLQEINIDYSTKKTLKDSPIIINYVKEAFEQAGNIVSFVHLVKLSSNKEIINKKHLPYINKEVRTISDGRKWFMFHKWLIKYGFKITINNELFIESCTF